MIILGLGGILSDAACALLRDGELVAAIEEKKIARRHTSGELPQQAMSASLQIARADADKVDCIALVRPFGSTMDTSLHLQLRAAVSECATCNSGASHGARGLCVVSVGIR